MSIFALADLHLSGSPPLKPMDRFSPAWENHWAKIQEAWLADVKPEDTVLIAGDTSWAMKWKDALIDLAAVAALPGRKILIHINNTNPILDEDSPERRRLDALGIEVAFDGLEIVL